LGEGSIITKKDIEFRNELNSSNLSFDFEKIAMSVKGGNINGANTEIEKFFSRLKEAKCEINIARTYCTELLMAIIRHCNSEKLDKYSGW